MWPSVFKLIGGSLLTFAVIWGLVLAWWQSNDYEPSRVDLALYLGALPFALVGGFLLLRGFIEHLKAPPPIEKPAPTTVADDDPLAGARARTTAAERRFSLCLVDAAVVTPGGTSAEDILTAVEQGKRPEPSGRLTDDAGFPVFLAEVPELNVDAMTNRLAEDAGPIRQLAGQSGTVRALALLDDVLNSIGEGVRALLAQGAGKLRLHVLWLVPGEVSPNHFSALRIWHELNYWSTLDKADVEIVLLSTASEAAAMGQVDEAILRINRDPVGNELILLLGAASAVDELSVEAWAARNILFSAKHQQRKIPGEGAVALLFASQSTATRLELPDTVVISRISQGSRDKSIDGGGRIGGKLIGQLIDGLLEVAAIDSEQIKAAVFDADHRSGLATEAMEGLGERFAHLDPIKDCPATGTVNGAVSPIGSLIALACARARVLVDQAPVLCISNQHEFDRAVLLATPFVPSSNTEPSST